MSKRVIKISEKDNVGVAVQELNPGDEAEIIGGGKIAVRAHIPPAHKIALAKIKKGKEIIKYGELIGYAKEEIEPGDYVHIHNLVPPEE